MRRINMVRIVGALALAGVALGGATGCTSRPGLGYYGGGYGGTGTGTSISYGGSSIYVTPGYGRGGWSRH